MTARSRSEIDELMARARELRERAAGLLRGWYIATALDQRQRVRRGLQGSKAMISLLSMRLLRAFAHLVLVLALIGVAVGPARAGLITPAPEKPHVHASTDHHDHAAGHASVAHHDHAMPAGEQASHPSDGCVTACCFIPSQLPPRAPGASAVEFFCAVRYLDAAQAASGRADAPEPGIPKAL